MAEKKKNIKKLIKDFWEMSRQRQESFLQEVYNLSKQNKDLFQVRLGKDDELVMKNLLTEIEKQTTNRIGKFRKIRFSKINEILRNANKFALTMHQQIELRRKVWRGILEFTLSQEYYSARYDEVISRHLDKYLQMIKLHILEKSEQEEIYAREKKFLMEIISRGIYLPQIEDVYLKYFH